MDWITFNFDSNQAWGVVNCPEEWERIRKFHEDNAPTLDLRGAFCNSRIQGVPHFAHFGFASYNDSTPDLGTWAKDNGMYDQLFDKKYEERFGPEWKVK